MGPMTRLCAGILAVALSAMTPSFAVAAAKPRDRSFTVDPGLVVQNLTGPTTVIVLGNPFRYPWMLSVNQQPVNAPGVPPQLGPSITPPAGTTPASGNPAPNGSPQPLVNAPASTQNVAAPATTTNGAIVVPILRSPGASAVAAATCPIDTFPRLEHCILALQNRVRQTIKTSIPTAYRSVCSAQIEYLALQARADDVIKALQSLKLATDDGAATAKNKIDTLINPPNSMGANPAACPQDDTSVQAVAQRSDPTAVGATVASVNAAISRMQSFPSGEVTDESGQLLTLQGGVQSRTADALAKDLGISVPAAKQRLDNAAANLNALQSDLQPFTANGSYTTAYAAALQQMLNLRATVLSNVSYSRFYAAVAENCTNLFGAGRSTLVTITRYDNVANSVTVNCPTRVFGSVGYAFSGLQQHTFTAVAANGALPQAPSGSPSPPAATIQETTYSDVRPMPVVLLNVRFNPEEPGDNGIYASFGVSVNSSPQSNTIDYFGGVSYSLARSLIVTGGVTLAPTTALAPGYNKGDPIAANGTPPTVTRLKSAVFIAISYGAH